MYSAEYKILSSDTDVGQRLRISRLFTLLNECAIAHTTELGFVREKTLDRGYLWVVTLQQAFVSRLPAYDETVKMYSAPGEMMHTFYPRHYLITDAGGSELVRAEALWMLMSAADRRMLFPAESGVEIKGETVSWETFMPSPPRLPVEGESVNFTPPYSSLDLNGHMNSTKYFDLAEDLMPPELRCASLSEARAEYTGEVAPGANVIVKYSFAGGEFRMSGTGEKRLFRIGLTYR